ncbi:hypothetical protein FQN57_003697 [Myotisia sp. PD_48]|nr:hypothetical protein FQN57_003697 [Myotisia sp. PD_48]
MAFQAIRIHLRRNERLRFCISHERTIADCAKEEFKLHRDILHAAFMPVLQISSEASSVASRALSRQSQPDLDSAFTSDARNAFAWFNSIMREEGDWCMTKGCPACVVLHVLHSEPLIRAVAVACRTSDYMKKAGLVKDADCELPSLRFWLHALRIAVLEDSFWGPQYWDEIYSRALRMEQGMRRLIDQCFEIRGAGFVIPHRCLPYDGIAIGGLRGGSDEPGVDSPSQSVSEARLDRKWEEMVELSRLRASHARKFQSGGDGQSFVRRRHRRATLVTP